MVLIAVHGSATRLLPAERGTVQLAIEVEDADRAVALDAVARLHERLGAEAAALVDDGAATWWGSDQVWVRAEDRFDGRDEARRRVHVASAGIRVRFRDLAALSGWILEAGADPGVRIDRIDWSVTREHGAEAERAMRVEAVQDAVARAEAYASAIGGAGVTLQAVWEAGLRPASPSAEPRWRAQAMSGAGGGIALRPDDIEVGASVTADFVVEPAG